MEAQGAFKKSDYVPPRYSKECFHVFENKSFSSSPYGEDCNNLSLFERLQLIILQMNNWYVL